MLLIIVTLFLHCLVTIHVVATLNLNGFCNPPNILQFINYIANYASLRKRNLNKLRTLNYKLSTEVS